MIITIDGPAGTGKTTIAKKVAERLNFSYFDTGAMYRAVSWMILEKGISPSDFQQVEKALDDFHFFIRESEGEKKYLVGDQDVTQDIRSQKVTKIVSEISAIPCVRNRLWKIQKEFGSKGDCVFEGRDMGTVVFPEANLKIFLTARPEVRAERRLKEMTSKNPKEAGFTDKESMLTEIMRRDQLDSSRKLAPLKCPDDAYTVDTSDLTIDEVVEKIIQYKSILRQDQ